MLAHPIPKPEIAKNNKFLFAICGNHKNPTAAMIKHIAWTYLGLNFFAKPTNTKAKRKVTMLYQPLTRPDQLTASP